jgi:hypothetical protein
MGFGKPVEKGCVAPVNGFLKYPFRYYLQSAENS